MRPLIADINLTNLLNNYLYLKKTHKKNLLAVLKANAYGHGAIICAKTLESAADGFAVACIEEAIHLKEAKINNPILLLGGVFSLNELIDAAHLNLWIVIHNSQQLKMLLSANLPNPVIVWLKMDSGMHRAGFSIENYATAYKLLSASENVIKIIHMTHFACADELDSSITEHQTNIFDKTVSGLGGESSMANSAAILAHPSTRRNWGRSGIALYGVSPFSYAQPNSNLNPVMRLHSQIFDIRKLGAGETIGYGAAFTTKKPTTVGLVAAGYADGYPRSAQSGTPVLVDGSKAYIIGRISMDVISIDITDVAQAHIGSCVELWGSELSVNEAAKSAGTIAYELLCNVKRAKKQYL